MILYRKIAAICLVCLSASVTHIYFVAYKEEIWLTQFIVSNDRSVYIIKVDLISMGNGLLHI